ncbi:MAG TPA: ComEC/Rec2 family competence protein [Roseimicrobium sp.]|nr:ComEC/Rec2 family competence protein [Roseimicrobium sp.]
MFANKVEFPSQTRIPGVCLRQPLLVPLLAYGIGIICSAIWPVPLAALWLGGLIIASLCVLLRAPAVLLIASFFLAGGLNQMRTMSVIDAHDLRTLFDKEPRLVTLRGSLAERPFTVGGTAPDDPLRTRVRVDVESWGDVDSWMPATGRVLAHVKGRLPEEFFTGRSVTVHGFLARPSPAALPGLFDYRRYLSREGVYFELRTDGRDEWNVLEDGLKPPLSDRFLIWAHSALALGMPEDDVVQLLRAMMLGEMGAMPEEARNAFVKAGTMHLFAISGLHIALIAHLLVHLLQIVRLPRSMAGLIAIPLLWAYTGVTGWQSSAIRSTIMMTVIVAGWSLHRPVLLLNSLWAAAGIILIWDPQQLFHPGFQLSFAVVASLGLWSQRFDQWQKKWIQGDPLVPEELRPRRHKAGLWLARQVAQHLGISLAAWIGSFPLIALYFHLFSPISLLANLLAVPVCAPLSMFSCVGSLLCASWAPGLAELFNQSAWFWMVCMLRISEWTAGLPGAWITVGEPSPAFIAFYVLGVLLLAAWPKCSLRIRITGCVAAGAMLLLAIGQAVRERDTTRIYITALPRGDFILASRRDETLAIDCGEPSTVKHVVSPLMDSQGLHRLPGLVLTHGDSLHMGGTTALLENHIETELFISPVRYRSTVYKRVLAAATDAGRTVHTVQSGDKVAGWEIWHPQEGDRFTLADDGALVLSKEISGIRMTLLSDLGEQGQALITQRGPVKPSDLVVTGVPTRGEPLCDAVLNQLRPRWILITGDAGLNPARRRQLKERLEASGAEVWFTSEAGGVLVKVRKGVALVESSEGRRFVTP